MADQADISIIIVNHYADRILGDCVRAAVSGSCSLSREVVIVDNPADEIQAPISVPGGIELKRISAPGRLGFGAACNLGAKHAEGSHLLFLNPDVIVGPNSIEELHGALTSASDAGAVVGRLTTPDGTFHPSCRRFPTVGNLLFSHGSVLYRLFRSRRGSYMLPDYADVTEVDWGAAALMMIRRELFDELAGFDERFFMYLEDTDLCFRLRRAGHKVYYVPEAGGMHFWGYSTRRYPYRRIIWHHRSLWRYFTGRHTPAMRLALLAPMLAGNCLLSLFMELFTLRK